MKENFLLDTAGEQSCMQVLSGDPRGYKKALQQSPPEELEKRESLSKRWSSCGKIHGGNGAPFRRFLQSRVGRLWDEVYSEIKVANPGRSAAKLIKDLDFYVEKAVMVDGVPWTSDLRSPLSTSYGTWCRFYVNPDTGILEKSPDRPRIRAKWKPDPPKDWIVINDWERYHLRRGAWYNIRFIPAGPNCENFARDIFIGNSHVVDPTSRHYRLMDRYKAEIVAVEMRQVTTKVLRKIRETLKNREMLLEER